MTSIRSSSQTVGALRQRLRAASALVLGTAVLAGLALSAVPQSSVLAQASGRTAGATPSTAPPPSGGPAAATPANPGAITLTPQRRKVVITADQHDAALAAARAAIAVPPGAPDEWGLTERDWDWLSLDVLMRKANVAGRVEAFERAAAAGDPRAQLLLATWLTAPGRFDLPRIKALSDAAASGDFKRGKLALAWDFYFGVTRDVDAGLAFSLCDELAETGWSRGVLCIASRNRGGVGTPRDPARALELMQQAATLGAPAAMVELARAYLDGKWVDRDLGRARAWLDLAVASGDMDTFAEVGHTLVYQTGPLQDVERGLVLLRQSSEAGSSAGTFHLAIAYQSGLMGDPDDAKALEMIRQLANEGDAFAMYILGSGHLYGQFGLDEDPDEALKWLDLAIVFGSNEARGMLGASLLQGFNGIEANPRRAVPMLQIAAETGDEQAMLALGVAYRLGLDGVLLPDVDKALALFRRAHEAESVIGTFYLGAMAAEGEGMAEDPGLARALWREAAEKEHVDAMLTLASALIDGYGGPVDTQEALRWAQRARDNGDARQRVAARRLIRAIEELGVRDGST